MFPKEEVRNKLRSMCRVRSERAKQDAGGGGGEVSVHTYVQPCIVKKRKKRIKKRKEKKSHRKRPLMTVKRLQSNGRTSERGWGRSCESKYH